MPTTLHLLVQRLMVGKATVDACTQVMSGGLMIHLHVNV